MSDYAAFLDRKSQHGGDSGFAPVWMPEFLFDFQSALVEWAIRKGRAAIFADCGLGKTGENPVPIEHPHGLTEYAGERPMPAEIANLRNWKGKQIENRFSHWIWRQYASAFWDDVRIDRVLPFKAARDSEDERHVHPLQLDVIDRALVLWSNPGETVLTPFMGVGSEVYSAVQAERRGVGGGGFLYRWANARSRADSPSIAELLAAGWTIEHVDPRYGTRLMRKGLDA